jgi:hypothetical protein
MKPLTEREKKAFMESVFAMITVYLIVAGLFLIDALSR